jgi:hypothetical protein
MASYRCLIRGENFPGQLAGQAGLVGFYLTRFVEAESPAGAEAAALEGLRSERKLVPPPGYKRTGQAQVFFEEIAEAVPGEMPEGEPGFVWFPMEDGKG